MQINIQNKLENNKVVEKNKYKSTLWDKIIKNKLY